MALLLTGTLGAVVALVAVVTLMAGTGAPGDGTLDTRAPAPQASSPSADAGPGQDDPADPLEELETTVDVEDWERLADCESGQWDGDGDPKPDTARWDYGLDGDHGGPFEGGLHFHPTTWEAHRDPDMPEHAGRATPVEEIEVAERVLDEQGWDAWPVCSEKLDLAA